MPGFRLCLKLEQCSRRGRTLTLLQVEVCKLSLAQCAGISFVVEIGAMLQERAYVDLVAS